MEVINTIIVIYAALCLGFTKILTAKPEITVHKTSYTAVSGTNVTLECNVNANGETITSIEWEYKVNHKWIRAMKSPRYVWTIQMPSLIISDVRTSDSSFFRCLASTLLNTAAGPAIFLNVQNDAGRYTSSGATDFGMTKSSQISVQIFFPVKIKKMETIPVFIRQGDTVEIRCLVDGRPEPKVTWKLANGTTIAASILRNVQENILILESVTNLNEGNYTCIAENSLSRDKYRIYLTVSDLHLSNPPNEDLTGSPLNKYVVPGVSIFVCVALIALIVVVILIRRKRQKGRTAVKPQHYINGQKHPSPSEKIRTGNNHPKLYVHLSRKIRKSSKNIDGNKSIRNTNIPQSNTYFDKSNIIRDTDASHVYMNINNAYAAVQPRSSTINSNSCINEETESENAQYMNMNNAAVQTRSSRSNSNIYINEETESDNTQVNQTEKLNYIELEFSSNAQDEDSSLDIRGLRSDTKYTEVVVFTR